MASDNESNHLSLAEVAYNEIKEDILKNTFPSGEFISISELSEKLEGMGRTPVREAVQRLHDERLLIVVPRKGIIIPEFDIKKMMDQLEVRFVLERHATLKALRNFTDEAIAELTKIIDDMERQENTEAFLLAKLNRDFHLKIAEGSNNRELLQSLEKIYDHHIRVYTYFLANKSRLRSTQEEHRLIVRGLRERDAETLAAALDEHYENTRRELLDAIMA